MSIKTLVDRIGATAEAAKASGQTITVDHTLPAISIDRGDGHIFHFQEHEAAALLEEVERTIADLCGDDVPMITPEEYLLYSCQEW